MKLKLQLFADEAGAAENNSEQNTPQPAELTEKSENEKTTAEAENKQEPTEPERDCGEEGSADFEKIRLLAGSIAGGRLNSRALAEMKKEEESVKESYPSFSVENEMKNPQFRQLLSLGVPVKTAFEAANFSGILAAAMHYAADITAKKASATVPRVEENPVLGRASAVRKTDVNNLTKAEIMKIIEASGKGERITFR